MSDGMSDGLPASDGELVVSQEGRPVGVVGRNQSQALGLMARAARRRPSNFEKLPLRRQWEIDKALGILDWDGDPSK